MNTDLNEKELGVIQVVMDRYNKQRLPELLKMREKVDRGEILDDRALSILKEAIEEIEGSEAFADRHPEFKNLIASAAQLYNYITDKALKNQKSKS